MEHRVWVFATTFGTASLTFLSVPRFTTITSRTIVEFYSDNVYRAAFSVGYTFHNH